MSLCSPWSRRSMLVIHLEENSCTFAPGDSFKCRESNASRPLHVPLPEHSFLDHHTLSSLIFKLIFNCSHSRWGFFWAPCYNGNSIPNLSAPYHVLCLISIHLSHSNKPHNYLFVSSNKNINSIRVGILSLLFTDKSPKSRAVPGIWWASH